MAGTASVAGEVFVDALPYFDQGYDAAGVREAVRNTEELYTCGWMDSISSILHIVSLFHSIIM